MAYAHAAPVTVGRHTISVQMLISSDDRDAQVPGITAAPTVAPLPDWPVSPEQLAAAASATLAGHGISDPDRRDALWAIEREGDEAGTYYWREARTAVELAEDQDAGRSAYLRGEIS